MIIITHDGPYHCDELAGCAVLALAGKVNAIHRTRDRNEWARIVSSAADEQVVFVDIGREFKPEEGKFDHHQEDPKLIRSNGVPYASAGLLWRVYGEQLVREIGDDSLSPKEVGKVVEWVDADLFQFIDAADARPTMVNDINCAIKPHTLTTIISRLNPSWLEQNDNVKEQFAQSVTLMKAYITRVIEQGIAWIKANEVVVSDWRRSTDKAILILSTNCPWQTHLLANDTMRSVQFVVMPLKPGEWRVQAVPLWHKNKSCVVRVRFPREWWNMAGTALQKKTDVADAMFVDRHGIIAGVNSKAGALLLANKAKRRQFNPEGE